MRERARRLRKAFVAVISSAFVVVTAGAQTFSLAFAEELSAYDQTSIEEDLAGIDLSGYQKDEEGAHRLIDNAGFMEFGYSNDNTVAGEYYGIYFYVYNPGEREVSERAGANVVNMAVEYDSEGQPVGYENVSLTLLDKTENNRFYKFRLTNALPTYRREKEYAATHEGERRYDVAGIQLWFKGDQNATDSRTGVDGDQGVSFTYYCTGFAKGFASESAEKSTLKIRSEKLETIGLDVSHTFYRTMTSDAGIGHQVQINSVYFTVPEKYFEEYGKLQRIKAEWYEYKTEPIIVTSNAEFYNSAIPYVGTNLPYAGEFLDPNLEIGTDFYYEERIPYALGLIPNEKSWNISMDLANASFGSLTVDNGIFGKLWANSIEKLPWLLPTKGWCDIKDYDPNADIEEIGGVSSSTIEKYVYEYSAAHPGGERFNIKDGVTISADLFKNDIDEERKQENEFGKIGQGYSYYDFDADSDISEILTYNPTNHSFLTNWTMYGFWNALTGSYVVEESDVISPILVLNKSDLEGNTEAVSQLLKIHSSDVGDLQNLYSKAEKEASRVVLFRFAASDYFSCDLTLFDYNNDYAKIENQAYAAIESVFFNFDIIQLTFRNNADSTVIPVVANPVDIVSPVTPPSPGYKTDWNTVLWILIGIGTACIAGIVVSGMIKRKTGGKR